MKALFHRLNKGLGRESKEPARDASPKEKPGLQLPKLPDWPPPQPRPDSVAHSLRPLPEIVKTVDEPSNVVEAAVPAPHPPAQPPSPLHPSPPETSTAPSATTSRVGARKLANGSTSTTGTTTTNNEKKVAFISPSPTPANFDRVLPEAPPAAAANSMKSTVSRFQAQHGKEPRGSTSSSNSTKVPEPGSGKASVKSTRTAVSPSHQNAASSQSLRSGTPYSQMTSSSSRIMPPASWSEGAEEDLVSNLGPRERTRQEVLWEIVASEERYVGELIKMRDTFSEPLLHPFSTTPSSSTPAVDYEDFPRSESPSGSGDQLPIAARFMTPTGSRSDTPTSAGPSMLRHPNIDGESLQTDDDEDEGEDRVGKGYPTAQAVKYNHPRSPYRSTATRTTGRSAAVPFPVGPSRSHQSLPPPPRGGVPASGSTHSLGKQSIAIEQRDRKYSQDQASAAPTQGSRVLRKFKKSMTGNESLVNGAVAPHQLPEDLRICLEVVESGILDGHVRLSDGLRKRYDEQYPLVRSLADVFVSNSHIFHGYATYVLHLERALQQVDDALKNVSKKSKKDEAEWLKVCMYLQQLEQVAANKGETGLAISLSKPFQRLLKYPLLFQNLLFHTDPSTYEYESTLQMVAEVETIVRSIEDEKIQKDERDKTRDVFARIEGLEKVRQLALPKPSRVLMDERVILEGTNANGSPKTAAAPPPPVMGPRGGPPAKGKSSLKRLSDVLHTNSGGVGGKKDLWLVVFNDVVLRCQRTGTTSLPLVAATNSRTNSMPELQGKSKYATTGRRNIQTRPRNLYKFIKIEEWSIGDVIQPRDGVVSMDDVVRSRSQVHSNQPRIVPMPEDKEDEDGGMDSDDSDRKSKMSFSYWGADKVTIQKPAVKPTRAAGPSSAPRRGGAAPASYGRESSANAKFGSRLVSGEGASPTPRPPSSRRTQQGTPLPRRAGTASDDTSMRATITSNRPEWNSSGTRTAKAAAAAGTSTPEPKRSRNTSLTNARSTTTPKQLASPAPSEDSGVGLYRQIMANDSTLNASLKT